MPRYYIKHLGGDGLGTGAPGPCVSCDQQHVGSVFLEALNHPDETPGDVDYTQVVTRYDEVVVPFLSGFLEGDRSTNITLQDRCPGATTEHLTIPLDRQAIAWVLDAFDREGPADPGSPVGCL